jgi:hypothetical protein
MGSFSAIFVKVDGLDEELGVIRQLDAESLDEARTEVLAWPERDRRGANMIDIYRDGHKVYRLGVDL